MDAAQRSHVELSALYSSPPRKPLLPTMNLRLGNRVLRLESQSQTAERFGKLTRASAWETASSLMQQRSQRLTAKHVEEGRGGGALNLAANFQSAHSLGRLCDSCDWSKRGRMQLQEREALRLGWVFQNESQSGVCCNENSAVGQAPLLRQGFPRGQPQECMFIQFNVCRRQLLSHSADATHATSKKKPGFKGTHGSMPTPSQAAQKYQQELETQLWKLMLAKDSPPSQGRRGDGREAGDRPRDWSRPCSSAKFNEGLRHQSH